MRHKLHIQLQLRWRVVLPRRVIDVIVRQDLSGAESVPTQHAGVAGTPLDFGIDAALYNVSQGYAHAGHGALGVGVQHRGVEIRRPTLALIAEAELDVAGLPVGHETLGLLRVSRTSRDAGREGLPASPTGLHRQQPQPQLQPGVMDNPLENTFPHAS
eukprot:scaffold1130_cov195-Pinguiococcus_pyrenoidosus.AAC.33